MEEIGLHATALGEEPLLPVTIVRPCVSYLSVYTSMRISAIVPTRRRRRSYPRYLFKANERTQC